MSEDKKDEPSSEAAASDAQKEMERLLAEQFEKVLGFPEVEWRKAVILELTRIYIQNRKNMLVIVSQYNQAVDVIGELEVRIKALEDKSGYLEKQAAQDKKKRPDSFYS